MDQIREENQSAVLSEWFHKYGMIAVTAAVGLALLIYGLSQAMQPEEPSIEIITPGESQEGKTNEIWVDVAGSVTNPGVYKLQAGSRVGDAIIAAGGMKESADKQWIGQTLNLAAELKDGQKIYIPDTSVKADVGNETGQPSDHPMSDLSAGSSKLININSASQEQLETLWGIGESRARVIMANRPYASPEELKLKAKIPDNVYEQIKDQISVY